MVEQPKLVPQQLVPPPAQQLLERLQALQSPQRRSQPVPVQSPQRRSLQWVPVQSP